MKHGMWWFALALATTPAWAQPFPNKPIRIIAQFGPGTSTDILARLIGQKLTEAWGQQVVVDNRPGAGAIIGTDLGAKAKPDGYTLTMAVSSAFGINPGLYRKLPYDAVKDFAPITNLATVAQTLVVNPSFAAKSVKDLVAQAKAKPAQLNYASLGAGSTSHLTMELFRATTGIQLNHVPYKGSAEAHTQILGGQIPFMFDAMPAVLGHIKGGKLRGLAVSTRSRSTFLPELPRWPSPDIQLRGGGLDQDRGRRDTRGVLGAAGELSPPPKPMSRSVSRSLPSRRLATRARSSGASSAARLRSGPRSRRTPVPRWISDPFVNLKHSPAHSKMLSATSRENL
jgi:tripartite-type tricarboxylate transporter receptor subunit TctC